MLGIGIGIVLIIMSLSGITDVFTALQKAKWIYLVIGIALQLISMFFWSLRWNTLLKLVDINISTLLAYKIILISTFVNNITPAAKTGGEPIRAYLAMKNGKGKIEDGLATVALDRLLDSLVFILLIIIVITNMIIEWRIPIRLGLILILSILIMLFLASIMILISFHANHGRYILEKIGSIIGIFSKKWKDKFLKELEKRLMKYQGAMKHMATNRSQITKASFFSVTSTTIWIFGGYFSFMSVINGIGFIKIVSIIMAGTLVGMAPLLPGGLGPTEAVNTLLFVALGIGAGTATAGVLAMRFVTFWVPTGIGLLMSIYLGLNRKKFNIEDIINRGKEGG